MKSSWDNCRACSEYKWLSFYNEEKRGKLPLFIPDGLCLKTGRETETSDKCCLPSKFLESCRGQRYIAKGIPSEVSALERPLRTSCKQLLENEYSESGAERSSFIFSSLRLASCNPWQRTTLCRACGGRRARLSGPGGCHSPPSLALAGQRPMSIGRARERAQREPAGGGALPFKEPLAAGSRDPGAWRQASSRFSRHVPAGELGVLPLLGAGRNVRPGEKRSSGAWGRRDAPLGARRISDPPLRAAAGSRLCPRWLSAGTPETRPPHRRRPLIARSPHRCSLLTACRAPYSNSCEPRGLVRRKPGTGRGRAGAGLLPANPALSSHPGEGGVNGCGLPLLLGTSWGSPRQVRRSGKITILKYCSYDLWREKNVYLGWKFGGKGTNMK